MSALVPYLTVPKLLARAVERFGDAQAFVTRDGTESFRELGSRVAGVAMALRRTDLRAGDRMLLIAPNSPTTELQYLADDLDAALVVAEGAYAQRLGTALGRPSVELDALGR